MLLLKGRQNGKGLLRNKMGCKNALKSALRLEKKRTDIFPPFGVMEREFEKMKLRVKMHEKMPFD